MTTVAIQVARVATHYRATITANTARVARIRACHALAKDVKDEDGVVRSQCPAALADDGGCCDAPLEAHVLQGGNHVVGVVLYGVIQGRSRIRRCALHPRDALVCVQNLCSSGIW